MMLRTKIILGIVALAAVGGGGYGIHVSRNKTDTIQTDTVRRQDIKQTVLATGQVTSSTDLGLSFKTSGIVRSIAVREGSAVKAGDALAVLDQTDAAAVLTTARGSLAQAQANYQKVLAGASLEAIAVAERAVDATRITLDNAKINLGNVKAAQETAVSNTYSAMLNTTFSAVAGSGNPDSVLPTISGTYTGSTEGSYQLSLFNSGNGLKFQASGMEVASGDVKTTPVSMGVRGLTISFASTPNIGDVWTISIPNITASGYVANNNAYTASLKTRDSAVAAAEAAVKNAEISLAQAQASLAQIRAAARPADVDVARAQILSAQGQVETAQSVLSNITLKAPADGTITAVDVKVGEQATALKEVMVLQDVTRLHVEANISEASIAFIKPGDAVDFTFDALGPDRHVAGAVEMVNPASVVVSGVVNYKVTATYADTAGIKPGMTANMTVSTAEKNNVLAVPQRAVISKDGKKIVRVVDDAKKKSYHEAEVVTGLDADGGLVEVVSGLSEGEEIVVYIK